MRNTLELLEWPELFKQLQSFCWSPYGLKEWDEVPFLETPKEVASHLAETEALKTLIIRYGEPITGDSVPDITPQLRRLEKGGDLSLDELRKIIQTTREGSLFIHHYHRSWKKEANLDALLPLMGELNLPDEITEHLDAFIGPDGDLRDTASPELQRLRQSLRSQKQAIEQYLKGLFRHPETAKAVQNFTITEREGRYVLPIRVEFKSTVPGIVHDTSSSGATLFVEPQGAVELNNRLQTTRNELERETRRILSQLSGYLAEQLPDIQAFLEQLGRLDKRAAAARFSRKLNANPVDLVDNELMMDLKQARHPLLFLAQPKEVVPNDVRLGQEGVRTLVITGPNTGGKTVLLKTLGLFGLMLQAGLHIPVDSGSRMSLFHPILADIGDQQSIEQNLSTFSAHLQNLRYFLDEHTDLSRGLVLIDEIAAGTDPAEGSALARAVLDTLYDKGALTVVTTHLGELKVEAHQHPGYLNASVEFNPETLSPTYRLLLGIPGTSNAITIAQKLGLRPDVIEKAKAALSAPVRESAALIEELEWKNRKLQEELKTAESYRLETKASWEKVELERQHLEQEKKSSLQLFKTSLKSRIHELEGELKALRKQLYQGEVTDIQSTSSRLRRINRAADEAFAEKAGEIRTGPGLTLEQLSIGQKVYSEQLDLTGEITAILKETQEVILQAGILKATVPVSDLKASSRRQEKKRHKGLVYTPKAERVQAAGNHSPQQECDVRGMHASEALEVVQQFLDQALLAGLERVGIIHGLGTGVLKKEIRDFLHQSPYVKRYYPAEASAGGDGKTLVEI